MKTLITITIEGKYSIEEGKKKRQKKPRFSEKHNFLNISIIIEQSGRGAIFKRGNYAVAGLTCSIPLLDSHVYMKQYTKSREVNQLPHQSFNDMKRHEKILLATVTFHNISVLRSNMKTELLWYFCLFSQLTQSSLVVIMEV